MADAPKLDLELANKIAQEWGKRIAPMLAAKIQSLGLVDRGKLIRSIKSKIKKRDGLIEAVQFQYLYYGLFHDVGADDVFGKGVKLPANSWASKVINPNIEQLATPLAEAYSDAFVKNFLSKSNKTL